MFQEQNFLASKVDAAVAAKAANDLQNVETNGHFMRDLIRPVRNYRLGDMLIAAGLLTSEQLQHALSIQKETKEQIGAILVREQYISAVQLYRKLAEQWCIKASAAGLTLMIQTITPSSAARADDSGLNNIRLAAAFSPASVKPQMDHPNLFGTTEIKSNDISAFVKWTTVMKRFESQMQTSQAKTPKAEAWQSAIAGLRNKTDREKIEGVNSYLNNIKYVEDKQNYGKSDYWATPVEFLARGGDCEDYAVAKYASLRALGFSTEQLRIAIVQDKIKNIPHAILIVYTDGGSYVLDNQNKRVEFASNITRYKPVFSINSSNWWLHRSAAGA